MAELPFELDNMGESKLDKVWSGITWPVSVFRRKYLNENGREKTMKSRAITAGVAIGTVVSLIVAKLASSLLHDDAAVTKERLRQADLGDLTDVINASVRNMSQELNTKYSVNLQINNWTDLQSAFLNISAANGYFGQKLVEQFVNDRNLSAFLTSYATFSTLSNAAGNHSALAAEANLTLINARTMIQSNASLEDINNTLRQIRTLDGKIQLYLSQNEPLVNELNNNVTPRLNASKMAILQEYGHVDASLPPAQLDALAEAYAMKSLLDNLTSKIGDWMVDKNHGECSPAVIEALRYMEENISKVDDVIVKMSKVNPYRVSACIDALKEVRQKFIPDHKEIYQFNREITDIVGVEKNLETLRDAKLGGKEYVIINNTVIINNPVNVTEDQKPEIELTYKLTNGMLVPTIPVEHPLYDDHTLIEELRANTSVKILRNGTTPVLEERLLFEGETPRPIDISALSPGNYTIITSTIDNKGQVGEDIDSLYIPTPGTPPTNGTEIKDTTAPFVDYNLIVGEDIKIQGYAIDQGKQVPVNYSLAVDGVHYRSGRFNGSEEKINLTWEERRALAGKKVTLNVSADDKAGNRGYDVNVLNNEVIAPWTSLGYNMSFSELESIIGSHTQGGWNVSFMSPENWQQLTNLNASDGEFSGNISAADIQYLNGEKAMITLYYVGPNGQIRSWSGEITTEEADAFHNYVE